MASGHAINVTTISSLVGPYDMIICYVLFKVQVLDSALFSVRQEHDDASQQSRLGGAAPQDSARPRNALPDRSPGATNHGRQTRRTSRGCRVKKGLP
jgi:hypothetical protein